MFRLKVNIFLIFFVTFSARSSEFIENVKKDSVSPFTTEAFKIFEVGAGLTALTLLFKHYTENWQKTIAEKKPLKETSKIGDFLGHSVPNIAYVLLMGGDYLFYKDEQSLNRTILMTKATLYSGAVTDITKIIVSEKRPNGGSLSFPSGHTTTAFAFSSVIMMEHSLPYGIAANAMATFVGFSRMNDNAHYLHDVIAGATVGAMYGVGLYYAQQKRAESNKSNSSVFLLVPTDHGLAGNFSFEF